MTNVVEAVLLVGYFAVGSLLAWRLFPPWGTSVRTNVARTCLAFGTASGLASAGLFAGVFVWGAAHGGRRLCEAVVLVAALQLGRRWLPAPRSATARSSPPARCPGLLRAAVVAAVAMTAVGFVATTWGEPHGGYDAISQWNQRARTLVLLNDGSGRWREAFEPFVCRPNLDYPLLLPAWNARLMLVTGVGVAAPIATAAAFLVAVTALCGAAVAGAGGAWRAGLAIVVLLGWDAVGDVAAKQMADVQVAFYVLAATICSWRGLQESGAAGSLALAGLATGCAAWTKNEGLLYGAAMLMASSLVLVRRGVAAWSSAAAVFAVGALPFAVVLVVFKTQLAPPNDIVAAARVDEIVAHLADPRRYVGVVVGFAREVASIGKGVAVLLLVGVLVTRALGGAPARGCAGTGRFVAATALGLTAVLYLAPYVITRHDQDEHIGNSMFRLLLHLWPSIVMFGALAIGAPEPSAGNLRQVPRSTKSPA